LNPWLKALGGEEKLKGLFPSRFGPDSADLVPTKDEKGNHRFFRAFELLEPGQVKCLVIGQDPYPDESLATGVAFLVPPGSKSQSLDILLEKDGLFPKEHENDLLAWSIKKGVLLINAALTFSKDRSLKNRLDGWEGFIKAVIRLLREIKPDLEIIAFGKHAGDVAKRAVITCCIHPTARGMTKEKFKESWNKR
jgi:uracil DNA glycosylase